MPLFLSVFAALALSACTSVSDVELVRVQSPVHAELIVRVYRQSPCITLWQGGLCSTQSSVIVLHDGLSRRELGFGCLKQGDHLPEAELSIADGSHTKGRLAFRCAKTEPWQIVYLGLQERAFLDCNKVPAGPLNWSAVPPFEVAAPAMVRNRCGLPFADLSAEIKDLRGDSGVRELLVSPLASPAPRHISYDALQAWDDAFVALPASERAQMNAVFRETILGDSSLLALERALRYSDLNDTSLTEAAKRRMQTIVESPPGYESDQVANLILRHLVRVAPKEAASLGCREMERSIKRGALMPLEAAALAVASGGLACNATLHFIEMSSCDASYYCDNNLCTPADLSPMVQAAAAGKAGGVSPRVRSDRLLLAAALFHGESRSMLQGWNDRHSYKLEQPDAPACESLYLTGQRNVPCHCFSSVPTEACGTGRSHEPSCTFQVDDTAHRIHDVRSL